MTHAQTLADNPSERLRALVLKGAFAALEENEPQEAEARIATWAGCHDDDMEARLLLGLAVAAQGAASRAAPLLQEVARARPEFAHPCRDLARLRPDAPGLVAAQFSACRALDPQDARLAYAHADFLLDHADAAGAANLLASALRASPDFAPGWNLYGMALTELGDAGAAVLAFRHALALDASEAAVWSNLGAALSVEGHVPEAEAAHDRAVTLAPHDPALRCNRAVALLRAGRMSEAWPDYEARLQRGRGPALPMARLLPQVAETRLVGRTVLAWHEEGFGDSLQFCRYLPMLAARGARVLASVPAELMRLFATLPGVELLPQGAALPPFDYHVPMFSLPRAFATTLATIPADVPYLEADPALVAEWNARLPEQGLRVGVVWAGQARPWEPSFSLLDRRRSMALAALAPLAEVPGLALVSLQMGPPAAELGRVPGLALHDPMRQVRDFMDSAAIVANLDVVVSVDTSVVHLAGALGRQVLLLDRHDSCWRWLSGRSDSPWYPTLRILRQDQPGEWGPVVRRAADILAGMAAIS